MDYLHKIVIVTLACLSSCNNKDVNKDNAQKFARWEIDSLSEISPMTPASEEMMGTHIAQKWNLAVIVEGSNKIKTPTGTAWVPNQSKIDKEQYINFKTDGSFELSYTESVVSELHNKVCEMFGTKYTKPGKYHGKYKCYDVLWCDATCNGSYGVVLFDEEGKELCRYAFVFLDLDCQEFFLDKIEMKDPYKDDITSSNAFCLHKH